MCSCINGSYSKRNKYGGYEKEAESNHYFHIGVYGICNSDTDFFVIDAWGDWKPPESSEILETVEIDGVVYDVYRTTSIAMTGIHGTDSYHTFWSVRRENMSGENYTNAQTFIARAAHHAGADILVWF